MNKHFVHGRLGADPEVRYTQAGTAICEIRVATERAVKRDDGYETVTDWITCVAFGRNAENIGEFFGKGSGILVEGRVETQEYDDRDGNRRWFTKTIVDKWEFPAGEPKGRGEGRSRGGGRSQGRSHGRGRSQERGGGQQRGNRSRRGGGGPSGRRDSRPRQPPEQEQPPPADDGFYDDDLPF